MTADELAAIRERDRAYTAPRDRQTFNGGWEHTAPGDRRALLAEVDRLREAIQAALGYLPRPYELDPGGGPDASGQPDTPEYWRAIERVQAARVPNAIAILSAALGAATGRAGEGERRG